MEEQPGSGSVPETEFRAWWDAFLADWQRRYPTSAPPTEAEARASFNAVWHVWQARERAVQKISNTWERIEVPRVPEA